MPRSQLEPIGFHESAAATSAANNRISREDGKGEKKGAELMDWDPISVIGASPAPCFRSLCSGRAVPNGSRRLRFPLSFPIIWRRL